MICQKAHVVEKPNPSYVGLLRTLREVSPFNISPLFEARKGITIIVVVVAESCFNEA
ncbi:hypothetical protein GCM10022278_15220 [Allohahella marinimesophila]|uniref:Uncharacterized protein n=1 Tax=Allohahella marinimesophila TaxID=1054972 RepID=A0ABP7P0I6_9GAMM